MLNKTQSISVRLSQDDYAYLMKVSHNNAITQSEKVRELITMAREAGRSDSFTRSFISASETIAPYKAQYKESAERSALTEATFEFMTEAAAKIQSCANQKNYAKNLEQQLLPAIEALITQFQFTACGHNERILNPTALQQLLKRLQPSTFNNTTEKE